MIGIRDAAYFLPGDPVDVEEWGPRHGVEKALIAKLLDNRCRYFHMSNDFSDADLACEAVKRIVRSSRVDPAEIDFLIYAHTQPFSAPAAPHSVLSEVCTRMGLRPRLTFGLEQLGCAAAVHAVSWAVRLLRDAPDARNALVLTSDRVFGGVPWRIRQDACIQSDGGAAILVGREALKGIVKDFVFDNLPALHAGPFHGQNEKLVKRTCWPQTRKLLAETSRQCGMELASFGAILPINADWPIWRIVARGLGLSESIFFSDNMRAKGHACSNDLGINLHDVGFRLLSEGRSILSFGQSNIGAQAAMVVVPPVLGKEAAL